MALPPSAPPPVWGPLGGGGPRQVLTVFKADTSDFIKGQEDMKKHVEETKEGFLGWASSVNEGINSSIEWLGKFNQGMEGAKKIFDFAVESVKAYAENSRLTAAAGSVDLERLSKAAGGLRTETDLLTFAARAQHGVIRAGSDDMETAEKAMRMLTRAGFDQSEVSKKVEDAMVSLKVNGLDDLGISVEKGKNDLETYNNLMAALATKAAGADSATEDTGESVQRMGVEFHDAFEKIRMAIGKLVVSLLPLVDAVAKVAGDVGDLLNKHPEILGYGENSTWGTLKKMGNAIPGAGGLPSIDFGQAGDFFGGLADNFSSPSATNVKDNGLGVYQRAFDQARIQKKDTHLDDIGQALGAGSTLFGEAMSSEEFNSRLKDFMDKAKEDYKKAQDAAAKLAEERKKLVNQVAKSLTDDLVTQLEKEAEDSAHDSGLEQVHEGLMASLNASMSAYNKATLDQLVQEADAQATKFNEELYQKFNAKRTESFLENTFGPLDEFNVYQSAFESLTAAVGASYEAIVTGQGSASAAFKKMFADMLMAMGKSSAISALKELAYAAGDLAFGNVPGAILHGEAAALHTAVAIAAGAAAHSIGTSAQAAAADKAEADKKKEEDKDQREKDRKTSSAGGSSGERGRDIVYVYGDPFADDNPRNRARTADKAIRRVIPSYGEDA